MKADDPGPETRPATRAVLRRARASLPGSRPDISLAYQPSISRIFSASASRVKGLLTISILGPSKAAPSVTWSA